MDRRPALVATAIFLAAVLAFVPLVGVAAPGQPATGSNASVAPGQQLGAVVDVGGVELETEVEGRAVGLAVAGADTPAAKAAVINERVEAVERRVDRLERRFGELEAARQNGSLSAGAYRARTTGLAARLYGAAHLANASAAASAGLPSNAPVDADAIDRIRQRSAELGGRDVAAIARGIAGPAVGSPPGRPDRVSGPPGTRGGQPDAGPGGPVNRTAAGPGGTGPNR
jgi:hypothetical protein